MIRLQVFVAFLAVASAFPDKPSFPFSQSSGEDDGFGQESEYQVRTAQPLPRSGLGPGPRQQPQIFRASPASLTLGQPGQSQYSAPTPGPSQYNPPSSQVPVTPVYTASLGQGQSNSQQGLAPGSFSPQPPSFPSNSQASFRYQPQSSSNCPRDFVRDANGICVQPEVFRDLYVYQEPAKRGGGPVDVPLPKPKVKLNLLVIKTNDEEEDDGPIIVEQEEKTIVLVLSEKGETGPKKVIEVPAKQGQSPEVFFIDYVEGDNSLLPGGIYLQDALKYATEVDDGSSGLYSDFSSGPQDDAAYSSASPQLGGSRFPYL